MLNSEYIKNIARDCGASLCGITRTLSLYAETAFLSKWIEDGCYSSLDYLKRNQDLRSDITKLVSDAKSVIVCAFAYKNHFSDGYPKAYPKKVASYALYEDYHISIRKALSEILLKFKSEFGTVGRAFTDSAPIFEKAYAVHAGLGWIGKQSLLITPQFGSFVLLGEIVINQECDIYDTPYSGKKCGSCRNCVEACPNNAIRQHHIDARLCISRATVEPQNADSIPLNGWIFGCDQCQSACPFSSSAPKLTSPIFTTPVFNPEQIDWDSISNEEFKSSLSTTPLNRSGLDRIRESYHTNCKNNTE